MSSVDLNRIALLGPSLCGAVKQAQQLLNDFRIMNTLESLSKLEWGLQYLDGCINVSRDHIEAQSSAVDKLVVANQTHQGNLDRVMAKCEKAKPIILESIRGAKWTGDFRVLLNEQEQSLMETKHLLSFFESIHSQVEAVTSVIQWQTSIYKFLKSSREKWQEAREKASVRAYQSATEELKKLRDE